MKLPLGFRVYRLWVSRVGFRLGVQLEVKVSVMFTQQQWRPGTNRNPTLIRNQSLKHHTLCIVRFGRRFLTVCSGRSTLKNSYGQTRNFIGLNLFFCITVHSSRITVLQGWAGVEAQTFNRRANLCNTEHMSWLANIQHGFRLCTKVLVNVTVNM